MTSSLFRGGRRFRGRGRISGPLRGLFADGVWQCNCDPRMPAEHFQTKNGGKNHGRWFYTCQKPQPKRCNFFLWDDEAKPREANAVLNNSRSEPHPVYELPNSVFTVPSNIDPQTPSKTSSPKTHHSSPRTVTESAVSPSTPSKPSNALLSPHSTVSTESTTDPEDYYDWPSSDEDAITKVADKISMPPPPETPRKAPKTSALATPGKRSYDQMAYPTPSATDDDVFSTPSSKPVNRTLFTSSSSPVPTSTPGLATPSPTPVRFRAFLPAESDLSTEIITSLQSNKISLTDDVTTLIKDICHKFTVQTQGIAKGRDISRAAIKSKDEKILELQRKITALEQERETTRNVIRCLRSDMAGAGTSRGRGRERGGWKGSKQGVKVDETGEKK